MGGEGKERKGKERKGKGKEGEQGKGREGKGREGKERNGKERGGRSHTYTLASRFKRPLCAIAMTNSFAPVEEAVSITLVNSANPIPENKIILNY